MQYSIDVVIMRFHHRLQHISHLRVLLSDPPCVIPYDYSTKVIINYSRDCFNNYINNNNNNNNNSNYYYIFQVFKYLYIYIYIYIYIYTHISELYLYVCVNILMIMIMLVCIYYSMPIFERRTV